MPSDLLTRIRAVRNSELSKPTALMDRIRAVRAQANPATPAGLNPVTPSPLYGEYRLGVHDAPDEDAHGQPLPGANPYAFSGPIGRPTMGPTAPADEVNQYGLPPVFQGPDPQLTPNAVGVPTSPLGTYPTPTVHMPEQTWLQTARQQLGNAATQALVGTEEGWNRIVNFARGSNLPPEPASIVPGALGLTPEDQQQMAVSAEEIGQSHPLATFAANVAAMPLSMAEPAGLAAMIVAGPMGKMGMSAAAPALETVAARFGPRVAGMVEAELRHTVGGGAIGGTLAAAHGATLDSPQGVQALTSGVLEGGAMGAVGGPLMDLPRVLARSTPVPPEPTPGSAARGRAGTPGGALPPASGTPRAGVGPESLTTVRPDVPRVPPLSFQEGAEAVRRAQPAGTVEDVRAFAAKQQQMEAVRAALKSVEESIAQLVGVPGGTPMDRVTGRDVPARPIEPGPAESVLREIQRGRQGDVPAVVSGRATGPHLADEIGGVADRVAEPGAGAALDARVQALVGDDGAPTGEKPGDVADPRARAAQVNDTPDPARGVPRWSADNDNDVLRANGWSEDAIDKLDPEARSRTASRIRATAEADGAVIRDGRSVLENMKPGDKIVDRFGDTWTLEDGGVLQSEGGTVVHNVFKPKRDADGNIVRAANGKAERVFDPDGGAVAIASFAPASEAVASLESVAPPKPAPAPTDTSGAGVAPPRVFSMKDPIKVLLAAAAERGIEAKGSKRALVETLNAASKTQGRQAAQTSHPPDQSTDPIPKGTSDVVQPQDHSGLMEVVESKTDPTGANTPPGERRSSPESTPATDPAAPRPGWTFEGEKDGRTYWRSPDGTEIGQADGNMIRFVSKSHAWDAGGKALRLGNDDAARPPATGAKEPWQMTREEYNNRLSPQARQTFGEFQHRNFVFAALVDGKPVPEAVSSAYPGIREKAAQEAPRSAAAEAQTEQNRQRYVKAEAERKNAGNAAYQKQVDRSVEISKQREAFMRDEAWKQPRSQYVTAKRGGAKGLQEYEHAEAVRAAVEAGKPVPPEVLADYPELAKAATDFNLPAPKLKSPPENASKVEEPPQETPREPVQPKDSAPAEVESPDERPEPTGPTRTANAARRAIADLEAKAAATQARIDELRKEPDSAGWNTPTALKLRDEHQALVVAQNRIRSAHGLVEDAEAFDAARESYDGTPETASALSRAWRTLQKRMDLPPKDSAIAERAERSLLSDSGVEAGIVPKSNRDRRPDDPNSGKTDTTIYIWNSDEHAGNTAKERQRWAEQMAVKMEKEHEATLREHRRLEQRGPMLSKGGDIVARPDPSKRTTYSDEPKAPKRYATNEEKIAGIAKARATETSRYAIDGVLVANKGRRIVTTDGRRLFMHNAGESFGVKDGLYLDGEGGNDLAKGILRTPTKNKDASFPPYEDLLPRHTDDDVVLRVDPVQAASVLRRAALMTSEESRGVILVHDPAEVNERGYRGTQRLGAIARAPEIGEAHVGIQGTEALAGVNPEFFAEAMEWHAKNGSNEVEIRVKDPKSPIVVKGADGTTSLTMPVNTEDTSRGRQPSRAELTERLRKSGDLIDPNPAPPDTSNVNVISQTKPKGKRPKSTSGDADADVPGADVGALPAKSEATAPTTTVRSIAMPEMVKLARAVLGQTPGVTPLSNARGVFRSGRLEASIKIDPATAKDPIQLAKTLAHEIGHMADWMDEHDLKRGSLLARSKGLRLIFNGLGELSKETARLSRESAAAGGPTEKELRAELWDLSQKWRPLGDGANDPKYMRYRKSGKELYADALSVLLNDPAMLKKEAPRFYKAFFEGLDRKPEMKRAYMDVQDLLAGTSSDLIAARRADIREGFTSGEALRLAREQERADARQNIREAIAQVLWDKAAPVKRRAAKVGDTPEANAARRAMDELAYSDNPNHLMLDDVQRDIIKPLTEAGLSQDDLGEYLLLHRIIHERTDIANPFGHTPETAAETMKGLTDAMSSEQEKAMRSAVDRFHEIVYEAAERAVEAGVYSRKTFDETITPNKGNYAAFGVLDYIQGDYVHSGIREQVGTFKDVANPFHTTILKTLQLNRSIELNKAKNVVRDFLKAEYGDEIGPAQKLGPRENPERAKYGNDYLMVLEDGRSVAYEVPAPIVNSFKINDIGELGTIAKIIGSPFYRFVHPLYVTFSPAFAASNVIRDFKRSYKNLVGLGKATPSLRNIVSAYVSAIPDSVKRARGLDTPRIRRMLEDKAMGTPFGSFKNDPLDTTMERSLERYGVTIDRAAIADSVKDTTHGAELLARAGRIVSAPFRAYGRVMEGINVAAETLPKVATDIALERKGLSGGYRAELIRDRVGTPDTRKRGAATTLVNSLAAYGNVNLQGWRADMGVAFNKQSAAGYWWRSLQMDFLPKAVMAAASAGFLGPAAKAIMGMISDDEKANYIIIPLGTQVNPETGRVKASYLRLPHDDVNRTFSRILWHAMSANPDRIPRDVLDALPGQSPIIDWAGKWASYASGQNPTDNFRGTPVVGRTEWDAGGGHRLMGMVRWQMNQLGILSAATRAVVGTGKDPTDRTVTERVVSSAPILSRFLRFSDAGTTESQWAKVEQEDRDRARLKLSLSPRVRALIADHYRLTQLHSADRRSMTDQQMHEYAITNQFVQHVYEPRMKALEALASKDDHASKQRADEIRASMDESAARFRDAIAQGRKTRGTVQTAGKR